MEAREMKILALDPSSTKSGYAVLRDGSLPRSLPGSTPRSLPGRRLIEAGILRPEKRDAPPLKRITDQVNALSAILRQHAPELVLLEEPSGHVHGRLKKAARGVRGLAIYGAAVGGFWVYLNEYRDFWAQKPFTLIAVKENLWTGGVPKGKRQNAIAMIFPQYQAKKDPGADVADAIGLAEWMMNRYHKAQAAIPAAKEG